MTIMCLQYTLTIKRCITFKLEDSKNVDIFKKKYSEYLLLQQEHD
jgi:hypothetical protein